MQVYSLILKNLFPNFRLQFTIFKNLQFKNRFIARAELCTLTVLSLDSEYAH